MRACLLLTMRCVVFPSLPPSAGIEFLYAFNGVRWMESLFMFTVAHILRSLCAELFNRSTLFTSNEKHKSILCLCVFRKNYCSNRTMNFTSAVNSGYKMVVVNWAFSSEYRWALDGICDLSTFWKCSHWTACAPECVSHKKSGKRKKLYVDWWNVLCSITMSIARNLSEISSSDPRSLSLSFT